MNRTYASVVTGSKTVTQTKQTEQKVQTKQMEQTQQKEKIKYQQAEEILRRYTYGRKAYRNDGYFNHSLEEFIVISGSDFAKIRQQELYEVFDSMDVKSCVKDPEAYLKPFAGDFENNFVAELAKQSMGKKPLIKEHEACIAQLQEYLKSCVDDFEKELKRELEREQAMSPQSPVMFSCSFPYYNSGDSLLKVAVARNEKEAHLLMLQEAKEDNEMITIAEEGIAWLHEHFALDKDLLKDTFLYTLSVSLAFSVMVAEVKPVKGRVLTRILYD